MKHKVGDKVRIKSEEWYNENRIRDRVKTKQCNFVLGMVPYLGKDAIITEVYDDFFYKINLDKECYNWDDDMFEDDHFPESTKMVDNDSCKKCNSHKAIELWIARDKSGLLGLYDAKPIRKEKAFYPKEFTHAVGGISERLFPEITWENSPKKVKLIFEE